MIETIASVIADAFLSILISLSLAKILQGDPDRYYRLVFLGLLFLL